MEILCELNANLLTISLNRPERRNALDTRLLSQLSDALDFAAGNDDVRALLIRGTGGYFSVGGDIDGMQHTDTSAGAARVIEDIAHATRSIKTLHELKKPVVAQVDGAAAGAGLGLALGCDIQIVGQTAKLTTAFAKIGLSSDFGLAYFLTHSVGRTRALELMMMSPILTGLEAAQLGIVTRAVPDGDVAETARQVATHLAGGPPLAFANLKRNVAAALALDFSGYFDLEVELQAACVISDDHSQAVAAFLAKSGTPASTG